MVWRRRISRYFYPRNLFKNGIIRHPAILFLAWLRRQADDEHVQGLLGVVGLEGVSRTYGLGGQCECVTH